MHDKIVNVAFGLSVGGWIAANLASINQALQALAALIAIGVGIYTFLYRRKQIRALDGRDK